MVSALMNLIDVFAIPTHLFSQLNKQPRWFLTFVIVSLVYVIFGWFMLPFSLHLQYNILSARLGSEVARQVVAISE
ncbi:MAG: hypothetical protein ACPL7O_04650, partial [Armatimonadota bacterium]